MMTARAFEFDGPRGYRLAGRLELPDETPVGWAIFAHCFTCGKDSLAATRLARALAARGVGVLRFDFAGLGKIGSASCRERVCRYVLISGVAESLKKKKLQYYKAYCN